MVFTTTIRQKIMKGKQVLCAGLKEDVPKTKLSGKNIFHKVSLFDELPLTSNSISSSYRVGLGS